MFGGHSREQSRYQIGVNKDYKHAYSTVVPRERIPKSGIHQERLILGDLTSSVFNESNRLNRHGATYTGQTYHQTILEPTKQDTHPAFRILEDAAVSNDENAPPGAPQRVPRYQRSSKLSTDRQHRPSGGANITHGKLPSTDIRAQQLGPTPMDLTTVNRIQGTDQGASKTTGSVITRLLDPLLYVNSSPDPSTCTVVDLERRTNNRDRQQCKSMCQLPNSLVQNQDAQTIGLLDLSSDSVQSRQSSHLDSSMSSIHFNTLHSCSPDQNHFLTSHDYQASWPKRDGPTTVFEVYRESACLSEIDNNFSSPPTSNGEFNGRCGTVAFSPTISRPGQRIEGTSNRDHVTRANFGESVKRRNPNCINTSFDSVEEEHSLFHFDFSSSKYRAVDSSINAVRYDTLQAEARRDKVDAHSHARSNLWSAEVDSSQCSGKDSATEFRSRLIDSHCQSISVDFNSSISCQRDLLPASTDLSLEHLSCSSVHDVPMSDVTFIEDDEENLSQHTLQTSSKFQSLTTAFRPVFCDVTNHISLADGERLSAFITPDFPNSTDEVLRDCDEYLKEIVHHLRSTESRMSPKVNYMNKQADITHGMRSVLVDWLVGVADEYKLGDETIQLAVNYVDRFLSVMSVQRSKLQLVGTACMFIAAKYEEIYPPDVGELVYITDDTYTKRQVLRMEHLVMKVLNFNLAFATPLTFLNIFAKVTNTDQTTIYLAQYMCELTLLEGQTYLSHSPLHIAAACMTLARHTMNPIRQKRVGSNDSGNCSHEQTCPENVSSSSSPSSISSSDLESDYSSTEDESDSDGSRMNRGAAWPSRVVAKATNLDLRIFHFQHSLTAVNSTHMRVGDMAQQAILDKYKTDRYHRVGRIVPRTLA